jgi:hypothetical protein
VLAIEDVTSHRIRELRGLAACPLRPLIDHPVLHETPGFRAGHGTRHGRWWAARADGFRLPQDRANHLVIMLDR